VTERDWTYRQLVYARNRLLEAAAQLDLAIEDRKQSHPTDAAVRAAMAEGMAHRARRELVRIWRRYEKERRKEAA
jgi:hypothetical protein